MPQDQNSAVPFVFMVLLGFIVVNLAFSTLLYYFSKIENLKLRCLYWILVLINYFAQIPFQDTEMSILLSWSLHMVPTYVLSKILFEVIDEPVPTKRFAVLAVLGFSGTYLLKSYGFSFTIAAIPLVIPEFILTFEPGMKTLLKKETTPLQKFIACCYFLGSIHCINFALFRMNPEAQLIGHGTTLMIYEILAIGILCLSMEENAKTEKKRLQQLVVQRTEELQNVLKIKDSLIKVVLHDIANPVQGLVWILSKVSKGQQLNHEDGQKTQHLTKILCEIIQQVRKLNAVNSGSFEFELSPVDLQQCLNDLHLIFDGQLKQKQIDLIISNELASNVQIIANKNVFTTSVLSNLVSNSIKFSPTNKELHIRAFMRDEKVVIEVEDQGIGIPTEIASRIFDPTSLNKSRLGTHGERGTGYGMNLAKSFVERFGGEIEIESRPMDSFPVNHGTKVTLTMEHSLSH